MAQFYLNVGRSIFCDRVASELSKTAVFISIFGAGPSVRARATSGKENMSFHHTLARPTRAISAEGCVDQ